ncbi:hypothetical protein [Actinomyces qiguomingii]|uniref:hypothetical protein n=2 Tax=Actinomyces qiguomingii TaxID=2057800 RepID=UPI000CA0372C|nr:hypothetical protein [Actinomyces qiguomingii]
MPVFATAEWVHWSGNTRPHSATGMHAPIEHEQAYTPPDDTDTITEPEPEAEAEAKVMDVGEQTTINQPQPTTTGAR